MTANGPAVAHSSDFTLVSASKPAAAGEIISVFMTGLGPTKPGVDPGSPFPARPPAVVPVNVTVNDKSAELLSAVGYPGGGRIPGKLAGSFRLGARISNHSDHHNLDRQTGSANRYPVNATHTDVSARNSLNGSLFTRTNALAMQVIGHSSFSPSGRRFGARLSVVGSLDV